MATACLMDAAQWTTINPDQIRACFEIAKLPVVRGVLRIATNSLFAGGINFSGNPHVDSMPEPIKKQYVDYYIQYGTRALEVDAILGFVPQTWMDHPIFGALPQHLDLDQCELQIQTLYDGRVIWRAFATDVRGIASSMHTLGNSQSLYSGGALVTINETHNRTPIRRLCVYVTDPPDAKGNLNSVMAGIQIEYEYLELLKTYAVQAYKKMSNPLLITEALESRHDPDTAVGEDFTMIANKINGIANNNNNNGNEKHGTSKSGSEALTRLLNSSYGEEIRADLAQQRREEMYGVKSTTQALMPSMIRIDKGRKVAKSEAMAKAPEILKEQEVSFKRTVYESLQIPATMVTSEGSKTSTNENAQRIYDEGQRERHRKVERLIRGIYNEMHWDENVTSYLQYKIEQFRCIRRRMKGLPEKSDTDRLEAMRKQFQSARATRKRKRNEINLESRTRSGQRRQRLNEHEEDDDDDDEYSDDEDEETDLLEFFVQCVTPQEAHTFTNIDVTMPGVPFLPTITALYKLGYITPEGIQDAIRVSQRYPDFYIAKTPTVTVEDVLGLDDEEEALNGSKRTLSKSGTKKKKKKAKV